MDIVRKRGVVGGQGNAAGDYSDFVQRSGSWQYGSDCHSNDIEDEGQEEDLKFGVPHDTMDFDPPGSPQAPRAGDWYDADETGILNARTGKLTQAEDEVSTDTKAKVPTYRHAQKEAMQRGDSSTYFMRKNWKTKRR